jgi:uncharacterized protein (TIGR00251 family)
VIRETAAGVEIDVHVIPRARKSEIVGVRRSALLVRLAAPPVDNAANIALIELLSDALDRPRRSIRIISGDRARRKRVAIAGMTAETVARALPI